MAGLNDIVQKALYLGVGLANYAAEKAEGRLQELRIQAQKLADEMVARGEMNVEEARKYVDELVKNAEQQQNVRARQDQQKAEKPRQIEILDDDEETQQASAENEDVDVLRQQVEALEEELRRLRRN